MPTNWTHAGSRRIEVVMRAVVPQPSPASWRVSLETPADLHRALFFRDALRIPALEHIGHVIVSPPDLTAILHRDGASLAEDWVTWWDGLLTRRRGGHRVALIDALNPPPPRTSGELQRIVSDHESNFHRWWATYPQTADSGQKLALALQTTSHPQPEGDLLARRGQPVLLTVEMLALDAAFTHAVSRDHLIVSQTSRQTPGYPDWLASVVFP
jgi:hypothetical protein